MFVRHMTAAAAILLAAAVTVSAPSAAYASVVEGRHAVDPATIYAEDSYGPGTRNNTWKRQLAERLGLQSADCPAGLEQDLWEETLRSLEWFAPVAQANLERVNALRASVGLPAVTPAPELSVAAAYRAAQIRKYRHFSHYGVSGEYLAYETARVLTGDDDIYVCENYYYEYDDQPRVSPSSGTTGGADAPAQEDQAPAGGGLEAMSSQMEDDLNFFEASGQGWLCASPAHYQNLTNGRYTRIGIGFSLSPDSEPVLDTMVQIFE